MSKLKRLQHKQRKRRAKDETFVVRLKKKGTNEFAEATESAANRTAAGAAAGSAHAEMNPSGARAGRGAS